LMGEALQHGGNERAAIERGRAHADQRCLHCLDWFGLVWIGL
jgi:hypothetical protein